MRWRHKTVTLRLEDVQSQQLATIGAHLRQHREAQGLSIDRLSSQTLIQRRILEAIETAQGNELPEPVYVKGFIQRYATALGLDGQSVAEAFPLSTQGIVSTVVKPTFGQLRPSHLYGVYLVLIAVSVNGLSGLINRSVTQTAAITAEELARLNGFSDRPLMQVARRPLGLAFPLLGENGLQQPERMASILATLGQLSQGSSVAKEPQKPVQIKVVLKDESWLRVVVDGKPVYEGVMIQGSEETWAGNREVKVRAGNAGGVMVALNDSPPKPLGNPGSVEEVIYNPPGKVALGLDVQQLAEFSSAGTLTNRF